MIGKVSTHVRTRSIKHVNIQAHEQNNLKVHMHLIVQLPSVLSTIIKMFERTNIQVHDHLSLPAYTHISIQVCARVRVDIIRVNIHTWEHAIIKEIECKSI